MNLEICPENIASHLQNDKNDVQANCLNINESGYDLTSRDHCWRCNVARDWF